MIVDNKQTMNDDDDNDNDNQQKESKTLLTSSTVTKRKKIVYTSTKVLEKTTSNSNFDSDSDLNIVKRGRIASRQQKGSARLRDLSLPPQNSGRVFSINGNKKRLFQQMDTKTNDDLNLVATNEIVSREGGGGNVINNNNSPLFAINSSNNNRRIQSQSHNDLLIQQQQQVNNNHDINGSNSRVRLLISPVMTTEIETSIDDRSRHGSRQQQQQQQRQMVRSATIEPIQVKHQQLRSQQQQRQQQRQKNYHHYDYFTDSDLSSSLLLNNNNNNNHHHGANYNNHNNDYNTLDNVLLFATEHNNQQQQQQQQTDCLQHHSTVWPITTANVNNNNDHYIVGSYANQKQQNYNPNNNRSIVANNQPVGRFVNYYPSWRQTQSPATTNYHHQNYSFHVPLNLPYYNSSQNFSNYFSRDFSQQQLAPPPPPPPLPTSIEVNNNQRQFYQARYGFVAPLEAQRKRGNLIRDSFKSRTIAHIPNMVKLSSVGINNNNNNIRGSINKMQQEEEEEKVYRDFYEKSNTKFSNDDSSIAKEFIVSEGDLLRVIGHGGSARLKTKQTPYNVCDIRKSNIIIDDGYDNPFKPNTELSWEADLMVRLMKRGYPINELPILVQTAKEIAKENRAATGTSGDIKNNSQNDKKGKRKISCDNKRNEKLSSMEQTIKRQSSINELSSGKQVWANSLKRTRSMPFQRFNNNDYNFNDNDNDNNRNSTNVIGYKNNKTTATAKQTFNNVKRDDADSIDKLIISIENEMNELLKIESEKSKDKSLLIDANKLTKNDKNKTTTTTIAAAVTGAILASGGGGGDANSKRKKDNTNKIRKSSFNYENNLKNSSPSLKSQANDFSKKLQSANNKNDNNRKLPSSNNSENNRKKQEKSVFATNNKTKLKQLGQNNKKKTNNKLPIDLNSDGNEKINNNARRRRRRKTGCCVIQ